MSRKSKTRQIAVQKAATPVNSAWADRPELWFQLGENAPARAATSSPVEAGVSLIANDISTLNFAVYEERDDGTKRKTRNLAANRVVQKPNHFATTTDVMNRFVRDVLLWGNAYLYADRNNRNEIVALYNVEPRRVIPYIAPNGDVYYSVGLTELETGEEESQMVMVPSRDLLHHRVLTVRHPLKGVSPLYAIGGSATLNAAISENMGSFHSNAARPGGVLSIPQGLKPEAKERLRREFAKGFGTGNSGRTAVLDMDVKWTAMGYSANDSQVVQLLNYTVEDVCRALRIPHHMMMANAPGNTASVEVAMRGYYSHCLRPMIEGIENRFDDFFELTGTQWHFEFDINALFRAETMTRMEALSKGVQGGIMTPNEARRSESLPPVAGGDGAFMQRQMTPVDLLAELAASEIASRQPAPAPVEPEDPDDDEDLDEDEVASRIMRAANLIEDDRDAYSQIVAKAFDPVPRFTEEDFAAEILKAAGV
jgi:HK97 family phage portal protein